MLNHLTKYPKDFIGAFRRLPTKLLQLFVQAYQSYLFNRFLSQRIKLGIPLNEIQTGDQTIGVGDQKRLALPLIGFKQLLSSGAQGKIERQVLEEENVQPQNFHISVMPEISVAGGLRAAVISINGLSMDKPSEDSVNISKRKLSLNFTLSKGSYATIVLRELMKSQYPIKAGF
jgi:tRNA pseudouridine13 synthase